MKSNFFDEMPFVKLTALDFDAKVLTSSDTDTNLVCIFFWGHNCPNCDVAKASLLEEKIAVLSWPIRWFHVNAYEESDLATRFGLYGIPVFIFFRGGKNLGRVTSYPGFEEFAKVVGKLSLG